MKKILNILLYIWQLPQNLLALCLLFIYKNEILVHKENGVFYYYVLKFKGGISLGQYVLLGYNAVLSEDCFDHEFGHTQQSKYLGWLYLPIIGVCSGLHCMLYPGGNDYYEYWPEKWANKLGGVPQYRGYQGMHDTGFVHTIYWDLLKKIKK